MKLPIIGILSGLALATLGAAGADQAAAIFNEAAAGLNPGDLYRVVFVRRQMVCYSKLMMSAFS